MNPLERELTNTINDSIGNNDLESDLHIRWNTADGNEIRNVGHEDQPLRQNRSAESMQTFSNEINMKLSQKMVAMMSTLHLQINRAISSAISERVIPEIQNIMSSISSGNRVTESVSSSNNEESIIEITGLKMKILKK